MDFATRYGKLNPAQKQAVDSIDGPVMVIAGPGTGKTELLSMRAANILKKTDVLPENILCLTFTDSGANAMRQRLTQIIGTAAYKVAIHTFHSFGTEIINQNGKFFYHGANFRATDQLSCYELLHTIFDELDYNNPLASKMNGEYPHLSDTLTTISELKKSGLTSDELLAVLDANDTIIGTVEPRLASVFAGRLSKTTAEQLVPLLQTIRQTGQEMSLPGITSLSDVLADSLKQAIDEAQATNSTKPITAWRNIWLKKNEAGEFVLKSRDRQAKLRAVSYVYEQYLVRMQQAELYDFDDMILRVVHAMEVFPELQLNLQEKYQYIMVDEFQDTNMAQMRILYNLTNNEATNGQPNVLVVGDDDQAIYSFQGADVGNISAFRDLFNQTKLITLTDNYRSSETVLSHARSVITLGSDRLENYISELNKTLTAHHQTAGSNVELIELPSAGDERAWVANSIEASLQAGTPASSIAVLARRHHEIVALLPYFAKKGIPVNYERRDNVLDLEIIVIVEHIARILVALFEQRHKDADSMLPELLAHSAFAVPPLDIWRLSLRAQQNHQLWMEIMAVTPELQPLQTWLVTTSQMLAHTPLEQMLDEIIGIPEHNIASKADPSSPASHPRDTALIRHASSAGVSLDSAELALLKQSSNRQETPAEETGDEHGATVMREAGDDAALSETEEDGGTIEESSRLVPGFRKHLQPETEPTPGLDISPGAKPFSETGGRRGERDNDLGEQNSESPPFTSPLYNHFFSQKTLAETPDAYLSCLEALRTIRTKLREYQPGETPTLQSFLEFLRLHRQLGSTITSVRPRTHHIDNAINLMTAHKSKGLEFDNVYIVGAVDSAWGERVRTRNRLISYPENLPLAPAGDTFDERLRLFFVAMTRARTQLTISYSAASDSQKSTLPASFLTGQTWAPTQPSLPSSIEHLVETAQLEWYQPVIAPIQKPMRELLAPTLENYKLSATHLNNFLDVSRGGPQSFLMNNLLRFPQAISPSAGYGSAVHAALQRAHSHLVATGKQRPAEDILHDFEEHLSAQHLSEKDFHTYLQKGSDALSLFLEAKYNDFTTTQKTELSFAGQNVYLGEAHLTGSLDLVDIHENAIIVTDYKTGKALRGWNGKTDYEKIKLHKYKQQLMFYTLLIENSRDYSNYMVEKGVLQFIEPTVSGEIIALEAKFSRDDLEQFSHLIQKVWQHIITLDLPDISGYEPTYKGMLAFENDLLHSL